MSFKVGEEEVSIVHSHSTCSQLCNGCKCMGPFKLAKISGLSSSWAWDTVFTLGSLTTDVSVTGLSSRVGLSTARIPLPLTRHHSESLKMLQVQDLLARWQTGDAFGAIMRSNFWFTFGPDCGCKWSSISPAQAKTGMVPTWVIVYMALLIKNIAGVCCWDSSMASTLNNFHAAEQNWTPTLHISNLNAWNVFTCYISTHKIQRIITKQHGQYMVKV